MANRPMMEHVVALLRQPRLRGHRRHRRLHGQRHPQLLRRRLGVRGPDGLRDRGDPARDGRLGPERPRELDERFLVISGDVLTDMDLTLGRRLPPPEGGARHHRPEGGRGPPRIRHRHHPTRTARSTVPGEAHLGTGLQRHHQHRDLRPRARDLRLHPGRPARSTSPRRSSRTCWRPEKPLFGHVTDGYWEDVGTLEAYLRAHQDILDGKVQVDVAGFLLRPGVWLGKGAEVDPDRDRPTARPSSATTATSAPDTSSAATASSAPTSGSATTPRSSGRSSTTTASSAPA